MPANPLPSPDTSSPALCRQRLLERLELVRQWHLGQLRHHDFEVMRLGLYWAYAARLGLGAPPAINVVPQTVVDYVLAIDQLTQWLNDQHLPQGLSRLGLGILRRLAEASQPLYQHELAL